MWLKQYLKSETVSYKHLYTLLFIYLSPTPIFIFLFTYIFHNFRRIYTPVSKLIYILKKLNCRSAPALYPYS